MKEIDGNYVIDEISSLLDGVECDYILALFPAGEASNALASIGLSLSDPEHVAFVISQLIMHGDELGWNMLSLLQKVCRQLPLPLHQLLAASLADYRELTTLHGQDDGEAAGNTLGIKVR